MGILVKTVKQICPLITSGGESTYGDTPMFFSQEYGGKPGTEAPVNDCESSLKNQIEGVEGGVRIEFDELHGTPHHIAPACS